MSKSKKDIAEMEAPKQERDNARIRAEKAEKTVADLRSEMGQVAHELSGLRDKMENEFYGRSVFIKESVVGMVEIICAIRNLRDSRSMWEEKARMYEKRGDEWKEFAESITAVKDLKEVSREDLEKVLNGQV